MTDAAPALRARATGDPAFAPAPRPNEKSLAFQTSFWDTHAPMNAISQHIHERLTRLAPRGVGASSAVR